MVQAHLVLIEMLADHYQKLVKAEGDTFYLLIENAYKNRDNFKVFIDQITAAEKEVDEKVIEKLGGNEKVKEKILAEQQQIENRRQNILNEIF